MAGRRKSRESSRISKDLSLEICETEEKKNGGKGQSVFGGKGEPRDGPSNAEKPQTPPFTGTRRAGAKMGARAKNAGMILKKGEAAFTGPSGGGINLRRKEKKA